MEPFGAGVKRSYDSTRRRERARRTRTEVLEAARALLLEEGYAATSVACVASQANVSVETIYKAFGNKPGLVRAVAERALEGTGTVPAEARSDALHAGGHDARGVLRGWGALAAEVAPRVAPILLLVRAGGAHDRELAVLHNQLTEARHRRMADNAGRLAARGQLRTDVGLAEATDVLWTYSSAELYELLVQRRGWSAQRYGAFITEALVAHLLPGSDAQ